MAFYGSAHCIISTVDCLCHETELERNEHQGKYNNQKKKVKNVAGDLWISVDIFPLVLFEQTFNQVRSYGTEICHPLCARGLGVL